MSAWTILRYLLGNAEAIRKVASSRAAWPTGVILVLLTAIARNYDQSPITGSTLVWLLGPLLFSLGSGSLVFGLLHLALRWNASPTPPVPTPGLGAQWLSFIGLFWIGSDIYTREAVRERLRGFVAQCRA